MWKRLTAASLSLVLALSLAACAGDDGKGAAETERIAVNVLTPQLGELSAESVYIGTVSPQEQVMVVPKTSGTVTETFFQVGDRVKAGDVLFKIEDDAARIQLANAQASYEAARAGVNAQNGGARSLQDHQLLDQIATIRLNLEDTKDKIDDVEDSIDSLNATIAGLTEARDTAQEKLKQLETVDLPAVTDDEAEKHRLELEIAETRFNIEQLQFQIDSFSATRSQLLGSLDQLEDGKDDIRDTLARARESYNITKEEVYPEADAASDAQLRQVEVAIDAAKLQLDFCTVTSPIDGVVEMVNVEKNGMAVTGNPAYIISGQDAMTVTFYVTESAKSSLSAGDSLRIERDGIQYRGTITEVGVMADQQTRLFKVKAAVEDGGRLPSGVSVKVYAVTRQEEDKLLIPYDALYFSAGRAYVYCVTDGVMTKTEIATGLMDDTLVVAEEGLTADSLVVENWSSKLRDGAEVTIALKNGEPQTPSEKAPEGAIALGENAETQEAD